MNNIYGRKNSGETFSITNVIRIEKLSSYLKVFKRGYEVIFLLDEIGEINFSGDEVYHVYSGRQYSNEMKVDYEDYCDESKKCTYEDLDENDIWNAKKYENEDFVVCNSMLELIESSIKFLFSLLFHVF